jgi:hypothetical protein
VLPRANLARATGIEPRIVCTGVASLAEAIEAMIL